MKVSAIESSRINSIHKQKNTHKKDLTSFGVNQSREEIDAKKSDEAIKTTFLSNVSFKGYSVNLQAIYERIGTSGKIRYRKPSDLPNTPSYYSENIIEALDKDKEWHPNSSYQEKIRKSVGSYNPSILSVYIADPQEGITKEILNNNDFIIYDNEPKFPSLDQLRRKYLREEPCGQYEENNYHRFCKTIFSYHERLKSADIKTLVKMEEEMKALENETAVSSRYKQNYIENYVQNPWNEGVEQKATAEYLHDNNDKKIQDKKETINYYKGRLGFSKEQQKLAVELHSILDESAELFVKRDELLYERGKTLDISIPYDIRLDNEDFGFKFRTLEEVASHLEGHKNSLVGYEENLKTTKSWYDLREKEASEYYYRSDKEKAEQELKELQKKIERIESKIKSEKYVIAQMEAMPENYGKINRTLRLVLRKLQQNFVKVEKFYAANARKLRCC